MKNSSLEWLDQWFSTQTDGDWEHSYGIKIETLDNPGWSVSIDISGTELEGREFLDTDNSTDQNDWIVCRVKDRRFEAFCSVGNLTKALTIFKEWALQDSQ